MVEQHYDYKIYNGQVNVMNVENVGGCTRL